MPTPKPTPRKSSRTGTAPLLDTRSSVTPALPTVKAQTGAGAVRVYNWGDNNLLPQELLRLAYDSPTAESCLRILAQFIGGEGFASEATGLAMANPDQTFNDLLNEAKHYAALGIGVALAVRFDYNGENPDIYVVEAECLRRERDGLGRFVLNNRLAGGTMPIRHNQLYLPYYPQADAVELADEVAVAAAAPDGYWGHLWWSYEGRVGRQRYPWPHWYAGRENVESDAQLGKYDLKQLKNGFFPDVVITLVGEKYNDVPNDDWQPGEGQTEEMRPYIKSPDRIAAEAAIRALKGAATESSVMLNTVESDEEMPQLDWVDKGPNSKGLTDMSQRIEGRVYRALGVPPVLDGVAQPGQLGSNQQIVNSIQLFGLVVKPARALITAPFAHLRPDLDFTVKPLDPVDYIDPAIIANMTVNEIRALRSLPPVAGGDTVKGLAAANASVFKVGDRVQVRAGLEHQMGGMTMGGPGTVEIVDGTAFGIRLDSMPDEVHKWYVAKELDAEGAAAKPAPKPTPKHSM